uniref:Uncharacterized protein n=1 Tax=Arundo donax TaxID=35708 RepID=A0A0A9RBN0_ARUDO
MHRPPISSKPARKSPPRQTASRWRGSRA